MKKERNNWETIVSCCNSLDQKNIACGSKKRRKAINYIDDRLRKLEQFVITVDQLLITSNCNADFFKKTKHLINETKFDLNGELFYDSHGDF